MPKWLPPTTDRDIRIENAINESIGIRTRYGVVGDLITIIMDYTARRLWVVERNSDYMIVYDALTNCIVLNHRHAGRGVEFLFKVHPGWFIALQTCTTDVWGRVHTELQVTPIAQDPISKVPGLWLNHSFGYTCDMVSTGNSSVFAKIWTEWEGYDPKKDYNPNNRATPLEYSWYRFDLDTGRWDTAGTPIPSAFTLANPNFTSNAVFNQRSFARIEIGDKMRIFCYAYDGDTNPPSPVLIPIDLSHKSLKRRRENARSVSGVVGDSIIFALQRSIIVIPIKTRSPLSFNRAVEFDLPAPYATSRLRDFEYDAVIDGDLWAISTKSASIYRLPLSKILIAAASASDDDTSSLTYADVWSRFSAAPDDWPHHRWPSPVYH